MPGGRHFRGAICSPLPAKPCGFVPGSKIFTEVLRRHLPPAAFSAARFAPRPLQSLAASFRGAKSSQRFRAAICLRRPFQRRDLLPAPPQSLAASFRGAKSSQKFCAAICLRRLFQRRDLLPAPCKALLLRSGEQNLHRNSAPPSASGGIFAARFAPRPPQSLAASFRVAKSSQKFRAGACHRRLLLALSRRQTLISPSGHANRAPKIPPGG